MAADVRHQAKPLTTCAVREIVLTGPPRWGEKHAWIVQDGPPYYKELAGPFSTRRDALDALAEIVNAASAEAKIQEPETCRCVSGMHTCGAPNDA